MKSIGSPLPTNPSFGVKQPLPISHKIYLNIFTQPPQSHTTYAYITQIHGASPKVMRSPSQQLKDEFQTNVYQAGLCL